jgi:hypothetical protein
LVLVVHVDRYLGNVAVLEQLGEDIGAVLEKVGFALVEHDFIVKGHLTNCRRSKTWGNCLEAGLSQKKSNFKRNFKIWWF